MLMASGKLTKFKDFVVGASAIVTVTLIIGAILLGGVIVLNTLLAPFGVYR